MPMSDRKYFPANIFQQLPDRVFKSFFTTTKALRISEAFEKKERVFCSFGCA